MIVLNVGGGSCRQLPPKFAGWQQLLLDIDPGVEPDIVCDALNLASLPPAKYDAVYCSHNLEHFYAHDVPRVLSGFKHVLRNGGFVQISVPNVRALMSDLLNRNLDINDVWYRAGENPITFHDVLYGWGLMMRSGNLYYAHKCGFTVLSLRRALEDNGFVDIEMRDEGINITGIGYKCL